MANGFESQSLGRLLTNLRDIDDKNVGESEKMPRKEWGESRSILDRLCSQSRQEYTYKGNMREVVWKDRQKYEKQG